LLTNVPAEERIEYLDRIALEVEHLDQLIGQLSFWLESTVGDSSRKEIVELSSLFKKLRLTGT